MPPQVSECGVRYEISPYLCFSENIIHDKVKYELARRENLVGFFP